MLYNRQYNFTAGDTIIADQVDDEFNTVRTVLNGNIEADNIKDNSITTNKLDATLDPTTRTAETSGDFVASGLELGVIKTLTGTWTNRDETISNGVVYMDGVRISITGGSKTFDASSTTYVLADSNGALQYSSTLSVGYNNVPLYVVVTDGSKITSASPLAWGLIGTVIPFAGKTAPNGYISCVGQEVSRTTYSKLFNTIQNFYGTPSSNAVFKVPDMRAKAVYGFGDATYFTTFGARGGSPMHRHNVSHAHDTGAAGDHSHSTAAGISSGSLADQQYTTSYGSPGHYHNTYGAGSHGHSISDAKYGVMYGGTYSGENDNVAAYITMLYIIKAY